MIGGGPGRFNGCHAASGAGLKVRLLEREVFPRHHISESPSTEPAYATEPATRRTSKDSEVILTRLLELPTSRPSRIWLAVAAVEALEEHRSEKSR